MAISEWCLLRIIFYSKEKKLSTQYIRIYNVLRSSSFASNDVDKIIKRSIKKYTQTTLLHN